MWGRLIFRSFVRTGRREVLRSTSGRGLSSENLKKEFEEYQKRAEAEMPETSEKKQPGNGTGKTMEDIKKDAEESVRTAEERLKQDFQEMKKQKTSLEFGDILKELKQKPKAFLEWSKKSYTSVKGQTHNIKTRAQDVKTRMQKLMPERKKAETVPKEAPTVSQEPSADANANANAGPGAKKPAEGQQAPKQRRLAFLGVWREKLLNFYHLVGMKMKAKFPKVHAVTINSAKGLVKLWRVTFPDQEGITQAKFARVRQEAKEMEELETKMKTMSEEEVMKMQAAIPEDRRRALVLKMETTDFEKANMWTKLKTKIEETDSAKKLKGSTEYKHIQELKHDITAITNSIKEAAASDASPTLSRARELLSLMSAQSEIAYAVSDMRKIDPGFDLLELHDDFKEIFKQTYNAFLRSDVPYLTKICGEAALAFFNTDIKKRETEDYEPHIKELVFVSDPILLGVERRERDFPAFIFYITAQELFCDIRKKDGKVVGGDPGFLRACSFQVAVVRHPAPDLVLTGHYWKVQLINPLDKQKLLM